VEVIYADTSVVVPYYVEEPLSSKAERLLRGGAAISDLVEVEFAAALSRRVREDELAREDARRIFVLFADNLERGLFARLPLTRRHYQAARTWLQDPQLILRVPDALHLAVGSAEHLGVTTADKQMYRAARSIGVAAMMVE